eukprot:603190-Ditylum_brightwellii.AAC.1
MAYDKAMSTAEKDEREKLVAKEHDIFKKYKVQHPIKKSMVLDGAKILTSTWAMNSKANGVKHTMLNV